MFLLIFTNKKIYIFCVTVNVWRCLQLDSRTGITVHPFPKTPPKNPDYDTTEKEVNLSAGSNTERHV